MRDLNWQGNAWDEYLSFQSDKAAQRKINKLISDIRRNGYKCSYGKPEMLKGDLSGYASIRFSQKDRLIFTVTETAVFILPCGGHYSDH